MSCLKTPEDVLRSVKDNKIQMIDLRFTDLAGLWQHFSVPPSAFDFERFERGVGLNGSSIRWLQEIDESDMRVIPDPATAFLDPFAEAPTLLLICNIGNPVTGQSYTRDPRYIAQKAEAYLQTSQIGDSANFGVELEHCVFNEARNDQSMNYDYVRTQMVATLEKIGINVEAHHHEVATGGHGVIDMRFASLTRMADYVMIYKYVFTNLTSQRGIKATFISKPPFGNNGSGMHVHQSIWQGERPLFDGDGYAGSSALMRHYIAGLLEHAPSLLAICAPTTNSYRSFAPAFEAPVKIGYLQRNRLAACGVPMYSPNPKTNCVEFRCPDLSCNPYLAFAAMLMAGIDGFDNRLYNLDPDEPIENLYDLPPQKLAKTPTAPGSRGVPLDALRSDHAFLFKGDVFTPDVTETHLSYQWAR